MFTVSSTDSAATLSTVKNGGAIVNTANYSFAGGKLTIKKEYLTTLADGAKTFTFAMTSGSDLNATVTVAE